MREILSEATPQQETFPLSKRRENRHKTCIRVEERACLEHMGYCNCQEPKSPLSKVWNERCCWAWLRHFQPCPALPLLIAATNTAHSAAVEPGQAAGELPEAGKSARPCYLPRHACEGRYPGMWFTARGWIPSLVPWAAWWWRETSPPPGRAEAEVLTVRD